MERAPFPHVIRATLQLPVRGGDIPVGTMKVARVSDFQIFAQDFLGLRTFPVGADPEKQRRREQSHRDKEQQKALEER